VKKRKRRKIDRKKKGVGEKKEPPNSRFWLRHCTYVVTNIIFYINTHESKQKEASGFPSKSSNK